MGAHGADLSTTVVQGSWNGQAPYTDIISVGFQTEGQKFTFVTVYQWSCNVLVNSAASFGTTGAVYVQFDRTPPVVTVETVTPGSGPAATVAYRGQTLATRADAATVAGTVVDPGNGSPAADLTLTVRNTAAGQAQPVPIDAQTGHFTAPLSFTGLPDGPAEFDFRARDKMTSSAEPGNLSSATLVTFLRDTRAPAIAVTVVPQTITRSGLVTIHGRLTDPTPGASGLSPEVLLTVAGPAGSPLNADSAPLPGLVSDSSSGEATWVQTVDWTVPAGVYSVTVTARDLVGNTASGRGSFSIAIPDNGASLGGSGVGREVTLGTGLNLLSIPVSITTTGGQPLGASELATAARASFVGRFVADGSGRLRLVAYLPGLPESDFPLAGATCYLLNVLGSRTVRFRGSAWPLKLLHLEPSASLTAVGLPHGVPPGLTVGSLLDATGRDLSVYTELLPTGRDGFRTFLRAAAGLSPDVPVREGMGLLLFSARDDLPRVTLPYCNRAPVVTLNPVVAATVDSLVTLSATVSDEDGDAMALSWARTGGTGPALPLTDANTTRPSFTPTQAGTYLFSVTAFDGLSLTTASATVSTTGP